MGSREVEKDWEFDHDWNNGIVEELDKRLETAKLALDRGDSVMARRNLEIFVMEVELPNKLSTKLVNRGEEPKLTNDGYLSPKFNAEYVIDRLPERVGKQLRRADREEMRTEKGEGRKENGKRRKECVGELREPSSAVGAACL